MITIDIHENQRRHVDYAVYDNKRSAVTFLELAVSGKIDKAYHKYTSPQGVHHNPYFPAGFPALRQGMLENHAQFPQERIDIRHVVGEGNLVAVHSQVTHTPGEPGFATLHLFRFEAGKIVELWDFGQPVPADSPNQDGMF
jgi:predicted SnoaL-like aldol condensation-catalyzing enzyme